VRYSDRAARGNAPVARPGAPQHPNMSEKRVDIVPDAWLTSEEALQELQIAQRTLQEWAQDGFIRFRQQHVPGRRPMRVYAAADVARLKANGGPPRKQRPSSERKRVQSAPPRPAAPLALPAPAIAPAPAPAPAEPPAIGFVSLEQFAELMNLRPSYVRECVEQGTLKANRGGPHNTIRIHINRLKDWEG
jgi:hypothetical protein